MFYLRHHVTSIVTSLAKEVNHCVDTLTHNVVDSLGLEPRCTRPQIYSLLSYQFDTTIRFKFSGVYLNSDSPKAMMVVFKFLTWGVTIPAQPFFVVGI